MSNTNRQHTSIRWRGALATACALVAAGLAGAAETGPPGATGDPSAERELRTLLSDEAVVTSREAGGDAVVVRVENGEVNVQLNGQPVPEDRIRREGDRLVILDENGHEITSLNLSVANGGQRGLVFRGGDDDLFENVIVAPELRMEFETPKAMIGIHLGTTGAALEHHLALEPGASTMITGVYIGLPAHEAGLREYDIVVAADGQAPADPDSLRKLLAEKEPGDEVKLKVIQAGQDRLISVELMAYDAEALAEAELMGHMPPRSLFDVGQFGPQGRVWRFPGNRNTFVDPDSEEVFERIFIQPPELDEHIRELLERNLPRWQERVGERPPEGLHEEHVERLERRLEELTERLNRLLEERDR
ncbi:MAG: PDZ domain-containing protein [Planctomycetota bacterium]|jgi:hypothetical protein